MKVVVPKCVDVAKMNNNELIKQRKMERQYLKIIMESLQYLGRQGIPLRGKEEGNDNFTQLLLLRGKGHPFTTQMLTSTRELICSSQLSERSYPYYVKAASQKEAI